MTATEAQWAAAEASAGFGGMLAALPALWINDPVRSAAADRRPVQLQAAAACGLTVPETLVTNDPATARAFCHAHRNTGVIYKAMSGGPGIEAGQPVALWATTVTTAQITDGVRRTTHLFQARVPVDYPVRVTVVGQRVFAARLHPSDGVRAVDWRTHADHLSFTEVDVPGDVAAGIRRLMAECGLHYASPDLLVTSDGQWVWIGDLNPNGQWAWIPPLRKPMTQALADFLEDHT